MRNNYLSIFLLILCLVLSQHVMRASSLDKFLDDFGLEVEEEHILEQIRNYLNPKLKKQNLIWYKGSILSTNQEQFDKLELKFNTFSNSLYIRSQGKIYSISSSGIQEFVLEDDLVKRRFLKGYGKLQHYQITATFEVEALMILTYISQYPEMDKFHVREFRIAEKDITTHSLKLDIQAAEKEMVLELEKYLQKLDAIQGLRLEMENSPFNKKIFYELLLQKEGLSFLKLNHKRISSSNSNALARHDGAISFDDSSYYLSNYLNELELIHFNKKSILNAISKLKLDISSRVPSIRNEKQLISWLQQFEN